MKSSCLYSTTVFQPRTASISAAGDKLCLSNRKDNSNINGGKLIIAVIDIETQEAEYIETEITNSALYFCITETGYKYVYSAF